MNQQNESLQWLCTGNVIPACRNEEEFACALQLPRAPSLISLFGDINSLPELIRRADEANYEAKRRGKNCVVAAP